MILSTGDVPSLFNNEEKLEVMEKVIFLILCSSQRCSQTDREEGIRIILLYKKLFEHCTGNSGIVCRTDINLPCAAMQFKFTEYILEVHKFYKMFVHYEVCRKITNLMLLDIGYCLIKYCLRPISGGSYTVTSKCLY